MRGGDKYSIQDLERAKGIVRIELRVYRRKIWYEMKKRNCEVLWEFLQETEGIARINIPRLLIKAYGTGCFVKMKDAQRIIDNNFKREHTRAVMNEIMQKTAMTNLQEAKRQCDQFSSGMKNFNSLGISPITIEKSSDYKSFEHPLYYIIHRNANRGCEYD